ncbi:hypothetical protein [Rhizobium ecuadorense]|nr:hypothetical protein [Rhizobium ecuadorense]
MTETITIDSNARQLHAKAWAEEYELIDRSFLLLAYELWRNCA